jgi:farnesyl-diphosphate farnesyltransferase
MIKYSKKNLELAQEYMKSLKPGTAAYTFCEIPLALALATLTIIENGQGKLTREQVLSICKVK